MPTRYRARRLGVASLAIFAMVLALAGHRPVTTAAAVQPAKCRGIDVVKDLLPTKEATVGTVEQAYWCILDHYVGGPTLDDRILLRGATKSISTLLKQINATFAAPTLVGDRTADWQSYGAALATLLSTLPNVSTLEGFVAEFAIEGMTDSLHDDHTGYLPSNYMKLELEQVNDGPTPTFGLVTTTFTDTITQPVYITDVFPNSPASAAGLIPGDTIMQIDGAAASTGGQPAPGWLDILIPRSGTSLTLTIRRPSTKTTQTVTMVARTMQTPSTSSRIVDTHIAYVKLYIFSRNSGDKVLKLLNTMRASNKLTGVVLDLRGNPGGDPDQATKLVSAFVHNATVAYTIDRHGRKQKQTTDNSVPLLGVPLAVLIDGGSASSSELLAGTVRDFKAGRVIGQRTAGALNEATFYGLNDGGGMEISIARVLGPLGETVDRVGISPDEVAPTTAADLSAGTDPALNRAVSYLDSLPAPS